MPEERTPARQSVPPSQGQQEEAAKEQAEVAEELADHPRDETIPGGRYIVDGQLVNAEGEPIKDTKD